MIAARSLAFFLVQSALTVVWSLLSLLTFALHPLARYRFITVWSRMVVWLARTLCGIHYEVRGLEHLPGRPASSSPSTSRPGRRSHSRSFCPRRSG